MTGETAPSLPSWIDTGIAQPEANALIQVVREHERGETALKAQGYEVERILPRATEGGGEVTERVIIVPSPAYAQRQEHVLEKHRDHAHQAMEALTPPPGRGKRPITQDSD